MTLLKEQTKKLNNQLNPIDDISTNFRNRSLTTEEIQKTMNINSWSIKLDNKAQYDIQIGVIEKNGSFKPIIANYKNKSGESLTLIMQKSNTEYSFNCLINNSGRSVNYILKKFTKPKVNRTNSYLGSNSRFRIEGLTTFYTVEDKNKNHLYTFGIKLIKKKS
ncbi:hypothetical protein LNTAR_24788 [Lentisphaera araneosa HTCC2155]|uniref:Uncharacterized protein n=1 Tax=Lentisphaera araneosa HTCC2155 TaxID=313628 RepID=A6DSW5_9BACT|nr:hypothetical protein LNTAR_24788 [Lentisphaera araneosa HTCC2155]